MVFFWNLQQIVLIELEITQNITQIKCQSQTGDCCCLFFVVASSLFGRWNRFICADTPFQFRQRTLSVVENWLINWFSNRTPITERTLSGNNNAKKIGEESKWQQQTICEWQDKWHRQRRTMFYLSCFDSRTNTHAATEAFL